MRFAVTLLTAVIALSIWSCSEKRQAIKKLETGQDDIYSVDGDDAQMNQAIEQAAASYDLFIQHFVKKDTALSDYAVKLKFPYEDGFEHMWLNDLFMRNGKLQGVLDSDPVYVKGLNRGDTLEVGSENLSDWMYLRNDTLVGGFTIRVIYNVMSAAEKEAFLKEVRFVID